MNNKKLLLIYVMSLVIACKPSAPNPPPTNPPSQEPIASQPQETVPPPETTAPTRKLPEEITLQEDPPTNPPSQEPIASQPQETVPPPETTAPTPKLPEEITLQEDPPTTLASQETSPEPTAPAQTINPLETLEPAPNPIEQERATPSQPAPEATPPPSTNPTETPEPAPNPIEQERATPSQPAPESTPPPSTNPLKTPPAPTSPMPAPRPNTPIAVSIKDPFLLSAVYEKIAKLERPKTTIALSYILIPASKLASFRANPQRFASTLNTWRRGGVFGATNFLNISKANPNYFLKNTRVPSDYFYRSHLRLIRFDFSDANAPTLSYKHYYSAHDITTISDAPLRRASFAKSFAEPWSLQDSDVKYLNKTFPNLTVHAGETFHLLLLLSFYEPSTKLAPYHFYDHPINLDNLEQFAYVMQE